jgi:hypothetical protein
LTGTAVALYSEAMTNPPDTITEPIPTPTEKPKRRWVLPVIIGTGAFILGLTIGGAGSVDTPTEPATVTKTVTKTPAVCDEAIRIAYQGFTISADIMTAASEFDAAAMDAGTAKLNALAPQWQAAASACQAS